MTIIAEPARGSFRAEELLKPGMPEKFVEVIEGELVMVTPAGWDHNEIAYHFQKLFDQFCERHPELHLSHCEDGFLLQRNPDVLLCPDAALFRMRPRTKGAWMEFAPEIAVEVLSPNNNASEIAYKRRKYFEAGAEQVWIAAPETQSLEFHFRDGRRVIVQGNEVAKGEGIAEGLVIDLQKLFTVRAA
jgi:Uma2 family endonuclease